MRKQSIIAAAIATAFQSAWAFDVTDPTIDAFNLTAGAATLHDSNLFRAPAGSEAEEVVNSTTVGVKINKPYSLQRFVVDASFTDNRYRNNSYLDYVGKNINASWLWAISPNLHGALSKSKTDVLNNFNDYSATSPVARKNIRTSDIDRFDVEWGYMGQIHFLGSAAKVSQKNSQLFLQDDSYKADVGEAGVKYLFASGSTITALTRETDGKYQRVADPVTALDSGFKQSERELRFSWNLSAKSALNARVAHLKREHDNFSERDFSGTIGSVDYTLKLTDKLSFLFNVRHDLNSFQNAKNPTASYSSYYIADTYSIAPTWKITEKTTIKLRYGREERDYRGTVVNDQPMRAEAIKQKLVSINWAVMPSLIFSASYQRQTRDANISQINYDDKVTFFSLNFIF